MPPSPKTFVGFGFGAIQGGLFLYEAFRSGNFQRLVVAEVLPEIVSAVRRAKGCYRINIATQRGVQVQEVRNVEILNPAVPEDAKALAEVLTQASEIATALPSVEFYSRGKPSVAHLLATAMKKKAAGEGPPCIVYTAENHNHAAEILGDLCRKEIATAAPASQSPVQFLNTVIGKMSGVVTDPKQIAKEGLATLTDDFSRAFLVEEFNRILITKISAAGFQRGIEVFVEKPDLLPFEEAKLYGHNAVHALLGYLAQRKGLLYMSDVENDPALMTLAREALLEESGPTLIARHKGIDHLFTPDGWKQYADDLLPRIINPYLRDQTERITRDTPRKLGWDDRLIGTMRLALDAGITPRRFALAAAAALDTLPQNPVAGDVNLGKSRGSPSPLNGVRGETVQNASSTAQQLEPLWPVPDAPPGRKSQLIQLITEAQAKLQLENHNYGKF